jgi:ABC-2 type transport system permease protein
MAFSLLRLRALVIKEFIQVVRDPRMRAVLFVAPAVQLCVFTYAATTDVSHVALAVLDRDSTSVSRQLVSRFVASGYFDLAATPSDERETQALVDQGRVSAFLSIPPRFQARIAGGRAVALQFAVDGTDANSSAIAMGYAARITAAYARERTPGHAPGISLESRAWFNPNLESRPFYVPGVVVMLITAITILLTAMALVREREVGTMEQLMVTPISPLELMIGKTLPFAAVGLVDAAIALAIATFWFQVPLRGSLALFFLSIAIYLLTTLSAGLLISTLSRSQQQALLGTFMFLFPANLLSGFMFPIDNMPQPIQWLTYLNPMRYIIEIMRGLFQKGLGLDALWPQFVVLAGLGVAAMLLAVLRFRRTTN